MTIPVQYPVADRDWTDPLSYIAQGIDKNGSLKYQGRCMHNGAEFRFSLTKQATGKYLMRGRVSAISPVDGLVLQVVGAEKRNRLDHISKTSDAIASQESDCDAPKKREKALNITTEIYCNSTDIDAAKKSVTDGVMRLYLAHADLIHRRQKQSSRPENITPAVAAVLYCDEYLATHYKGCSDSTFASYGREIKRHFANFPNIPMHKVKKKQMEAYLTTAAVGANCRNRLSKFWGFCVDRGICLDSNPFPAPAKRKVADEAKQKKASTPEELSLDMQDKLFDHLKNDINSPNCGVALQPWGGFAAKAICNFCWRDVEFDPVRRDFARIKFHRDELAGSTHDYTRPLFPQAALLLRLRYEQLLCEYSAEELSLMPIAATKSNPKKAMSPDALTQYAGLILRTIGVSETVFASLKAPGEAVSKKVLQNTYTKNVILRSNLTDDPGTVSFLHGEPLRASTTDDHYTSFVSPAAAERIYTALRAITPFEPIALPSPSVDVDGCEKHVFIPENTRQTVGCIGAVILQPGEELVIDCPHGVTGSVRAREISDSGEVKRKPRSSNKI